MKVINVRGANGSGKSYLIRKWMEDRSAVPYPRRNNLLGGQSLCAEPEYYRCSDLGAIIGTYESGNGGCDRIHTTEEVQKRIRKAAAMPGVPYVLFEGVIISTVYETWQKFSQEMGGMLWVYLDTPLEECLRRVRGRNRGVKFNEQLVKDKIRNIEATKTKAIEAGEEVLILPWNKAYPCFQKLLTGIAAGMQKKRK